MGACTLRIAPVSPGAKAVGLDTSRASHTAWCSPSPRRRPYRSTIPGYAFPMTRVTKVTVERSCAICERTLLMGERATRFSPNGGADYVDVCPLCAETAVEYGWIREGAPTSPTVPAARRRKGGRGLLQMLLGTGPRVPAETVASEPILRRLS